MRIDKRKFRGLANRKNLRLIYTEKSTEALKYGATYDGKGEGGVGGATIMPSCPSCF